MTDAQLNDVGHENARTRGDIVAATVIAQFYDFASRCMDWAKSTHSLQERALYVQMGLQWLAAGARLQTAMAKSALKAAALDIELAAHHRQIQSDRLSQDLASHIGGLHDATEE
jgi:hypothetical protein